MKKRVVGLAVFLSCLTPMCSYPQTYPFQYYTTADGLAQSNVSAIFQDQRGFIWFGTSGGICRYDGNKIWSYKNGAFRVLCMTEDLSGKLWIGTTSGLATFTFPDTTFQWMKSSGNILPSDLVLTLLTDHQGNLWIGTDQGLLCQRRVGGHLLLNHVGGLLHDYVHSLIEDPRGKIIVGTAGGIQRITLRNDGSPQIETLARLQAGKLAMLHSGAILGSDLRYRSVRLCVNDSMRTIYSTSVQGSGVYPTGFLEDTDGSIWIGTTAGIVVLDNQRVTRITRREGLPNSFINALLRDREGNLWFGTESGVAKRPFELSNIYNSITGLPEDHVIAIFLDSRRSAWFGTYNGAACIDANGEVHTFGYSEGLPHLSVHDFCEDAQGNIWIGTFSGLRLFSHGKLRMPHNVRLRTTRIVSLLSDSNGTIWCGGNREILQVSPRGEIKTVVDQRMIMRSNVSSLYKDSKGRLWFGTDDEGAGCIEDGRISMFDGNAGLPDLWVMSIMEDKHGQIWMTTQKGVVRWNGSRFEPMPVQEDPLRNDAVAFAVRDSAEHMWFGTQHGIYEWDDSLVGHWDAQSGIAADATRRGFVDRQGNIWVGTVGGASKLNPRTLRMRNAPPPVYLECIELENRSGTFTPERQLGYEDNTLVFHFNALSFIDEHRIEFRWMLAGFDKSWQPAASGRTVRYTHLPPGRYEFFVSARNRGVPWSTPARMPFAINSPYWGTWWFVSLVSLSLIALVVGIVQRRIRGLEKDRRLQQDFAAQLMNSQEYERKRIASELHDSLGQDLLVIRNRALLGLRDGGLDAPGRTQLEQISSIAAEAINDVREISHNLRPYQLDRLGFRKAVSSLVHGIADSSSIVFTAQIEDVDDAVAGESAIHLYRIIQEGLNNILRHAAATEASINVRRDHLIIRIVLRDNGIGISKVTAEDQSHRQGLGLTSMAERAKVLGGQLTVDSTPGKGTTVTILIPQVNHS